MIDIALEQYLLPSWPHRRMNSAVPGNVVRMCCKVVRGRGAFDGKQGFTYFEGVSKESAGSSAICLHLLTIPPGGRAHVHLHDSHETAIYVLEGRAEMLYGPNLENHIRVEAGDYLYIPAGMPHVPWNPSADTPAKAVIARTDPNEQESVVLRPDLEPILEQYLAKPSECQV